MAANKESTAAPPATNDAYTGMLAIALIVLIVGCVFLYLDYSQYPDSKAPVVPKAPAVVLPATPSPQGGAQAVPPKAEDPANADAPPPK
jgi:hypothetical protein